MALTTDFPRVWNNPHTTDPDRKRLVRLLVEDVTLIKIHEVILQVRFRGGATHTLTLPAPRQCWQMVETAPETVQTIDVLLNEYTDQQVAAILNEQGLRPGKGGAFRARLVANVRRAYGLKSRYERLRDAGMLSIEELAEVLAINKKTVQAWHKAGLIHGHAYNDKNSCLFEPPGADAPVKSQGKKLTQRRRFPESKFESERAKEVQYES
jgi:DNA-binding transcriptional regulator YiaG